ncbi:MAG: hypothetical protein EBX40_06190 [Gammaproteobacteria bacterium]|nr:hypothetical protein [Gammaproteobacteria bacterium]
MDDVLIISAKIDNDEYSGGLRGSAAEILTLAEARGRHARAIRLALPVDQAVEDFLLQMKQLVAQVKEASKVSIPVHSPAKTTCPIVLRVQHGQQTCELKLGAAFALDPNDQSLAQLQSAFGHDAVSVVYE